MKLKLIQFETSNSSRYFTMKPINIKYQNLFNKVCDMLYINDNCFIGAFVINKKLNG